MKQTTKYLENKLAKINAELGRIEAKIVLLAKTNVVILNSYSFSENWNFYSVVEDVPKYLHSEVISIFGDSNFTCEAIDNGCNLIFNLEVL